jgi:2-polyprenyl-6-methoxyphenol hydroxylase-like FAD-dependent oxidoreductase
LDEQNLSIETVKEEVLSIYRGYHEPIETPISQARPPIKLNVYDIQALPSWHDGRVILIGDAAHAVSPSAGHGASKASWPGQAPKQRKENRLAV